MKVMIGVVKTAKDILETKKNVVSFCLLDNGHHYAFDEQMDAWGKTKNIVVFVDVRAIVAHHESFAWAGSMDGHSLHFFRPEWVNVVDAETDMDDNDPRVLGLARGLSGAKGKKIEDFLGGLIKEEPPTEE